MTVQTITTGSRDDLRPWGFSYGRIPWIVDPKRLLGGNKMVAVDLIIDYECGELNDVRTLKMFAEMVKDGSAWTLQGHYGRTAHALIEDRFITQAGELTEKAQDFIDLNE